MPSSIILVVDDEPVITETLVLILNRYKEEFFAVGTTKVDEALSIVRGIQPDLVVLDAMMPGVHGLEHATEMRDKYGCSVLIISGQTATGGFLDESNRAGNDPFEVLAKPIHPHDLIEKIREMLGRQPQSVWTN